MIHLDGKSAGLMQNVCPCAQKTFIAKSCIYRNRRAQCRIRPSGQIWGGFTLHSVRQINIFVAVVVAELLPCFSA